MKPFRLASWTEIPLVAVFRTAPHSIKGLKPGLFAHWVASSIVFANARHSGSETGGPVVDSASTTAGACSTDSAGADDATFRSDRAHPPRAAAMRTPRASQHRGWQIERIRLHSLAEGIRS